MKLHECLKRVSSFLIKNAIFPRANRRTHYRVRPAIEVLETRRLLSGSSSASSSILDTYAQNPLSFEPNVGQTAAQVQFLSRGPGYALYLTPDEAVLSLQQPSGTSNLTATPSASPAPAVLTMQLVGANATAGSTGLDKMASTTNYLGATQATSLTDIPNYGQVEYQNVYAGVNLIYFGNQQQLEFNFTVAPGADPHAIALQFQGADSITLDNAGDLVLHTVGGDVVENAPVVYQTIDGIQQTVTGAYVMQGTSQVGFQLGTYDHSQPLVIDPVVVYSTYLGGSGNDTGTSIAVDSSGNTYVTGSTASVNFPTTPGALQPAFTSNGDTTTYVTKFDPSGKIMLSTYLGGNETSTQFVDNGASSIAVDKAGNVYITGSAAINTNEVPYVPFPTTLTPFPSSGDQLQQNYGGFGAYVAELNPTLSQLVYSTYVPSALDDDSGSSIAVDAAGNAYVAGATIQAGTYFQNPFVSKLAPGGAVAYNETFGSLSTFDPNVHSFPDGGSAANGIAVDSAGNAYVVGTTDADAFGSYPAPQTTPDVGGYSVFVQRLDPQGGQTYLAEVGGAGGDNIGHAIAVDAAGDAYVTGETSSAVFPTTMNPYQGTLRAADSVYNAFVFKLNPAGKQLIYSTYLGGSGNAFGGGYIYDGNLSTADGDSGNGIAVDSAGNAYVVGDTNSLDFPTVNAVQTSFGNGIQDAFVSELNAGGSGLLYSTYYSGTQADQGTEGNGAIAEPPFAFDMGSAIAMDSYGNAYITGSTTSAFLPTQNAVQPTFGGGTEGDSIDYSNGSDAFVVKLASRVIVTAQPVDPTLGQSFTAEVATFTAPDPGLPGSNYTVSINWGDGTVIDVATDVRQTQNAAAPYQVFGTHSYTKLGAYVINVTVTDNKYGLTGNTAYNVSQLPGNQSETTIAVDPVVNPTDPNNVQVFAASNDNTTTSVLFAARSSDGGGTWTPSTDSSGLLTPASGTAPTSRGDPRAVFDQFGDLFLAELGASGKAIVVLMSTDGGKTFSVVEAFASQGSAPIGSDDPEDAIVDQPSIAVGPGNQPGTVSVWVTWADFGASTVQAAGALVTVTGQGDTRQVQVGSFNIEDVGGGQLGNFGNIAVGPSGQVLVTWENLGTTSPEAIMVSENPDGLKNPANFSKPIALSPVLAISEQNITPQPSRGITPNIRLAWDRSGGPHNGRVYLVYTDAPDFTNFPNDTDVFLRYSDNNGATWSAPVRVNDDTGHNSQFFASVAVDQSTGDVAVAWYDARNDPLNQQTQYFVAVSADGGATFSPNVPVSPGPSSTYFATGSNQYGDYEGLAFVNGMLYPIWTDNSAALGSNPDLPAGAGFASRYDVAVARVAVATVTAPLPPVITGLPISIAEGQTFSGMVATFTDANASLMSSDFIASINWGDGTSARGSITPSGDLDNHFIILGSHQYVTAGSYIVTVTVHDDVNNLDGTTETNVSHLNGNQTDGTITVDPMDSSLLFAASSEEGTGLYTATSSDAGVTWTGQTIAAGGADGLPLAGGQPQAAFDQFGNLYLAYADQTGQNIVVLMSTDGGQTFTTLDTFSSADGVSRPLITGGPGPNGAANIWVAFLQGTTQIDATGVDVDTLGLAGVGVFNPVQVVVSAVAGATLNLGGIAVGPTGQVLVSFQSQTTAAEPSAIYAALDANGLSGSFGSALLVTSTNVGGAYAIPPQQTHTIGIGASLAWDRSGGNNNGRVYVVYTDAATLGSNATKIFLRSSDNNGKTWSDPVQVSDDVGGSSEFLPSIAVDQSDGDVGVAWYDSRNDSSDVTTQFFAAVSINGGQSFSPNAPVGLGSSDATNANLNAYGQQNQYGDYTGVAFAGGILYPVWADNSSQLSGNPDLPQFDLAEARPGVAHVADLPLSATPLDVSAEVKDEGGAFTADLATFTDPDPNAQASLYTATIDWGDPDPNTGAADTTTGTIEDNGGGMFTVSGTHVYQAASAYTITITIEDKGGSSIAVTTPALIQDAPLNPGGDVTLAAVRGQSFQAIVGTFSDTDPNGAPDDYSTTIDWGDGQQSGGLVTFAGSAALTYDSANNTLYTFGNNDLVDNNPSYLMAISLQGVVTPVAAVDGTFYGGLAFDPNNGTLYALSNGDSGVSTLMRFDFSAQTFSPVAVLGSGFTGGLAFNSADGNLYAVAGADGSSWALDKISPATGAVTTLGILAPAGNQPPITYTGLSFYSDGNAYAVGNDSDGNSTLYRVTINGSVTITSIGQLGNNLTTPPSTQEGFTGGLAFVPGTGSPLAGSLLGISGDGSGTTYINTIDLDATTASVFEVFVAGSGKSGSGDFSNGFNTIGTHTYTQVITAPLTVMITDVEPSQVPDSVLRSTATDFGTVTVIPLPPQALPAPLPFTAYQGYATDALNLASFTVPGGPATGPNVYSATINWHDGGPLDTGVVAISGTTIEVSGQHTYATQGTFTPTVVLHDDTGGSATATAAVNVAADLTALPAPAAVTAFQGDGTGTLSLASFSIPAGFPGAGSSSYTATIDWGDNSPTSQGTVQLTGLTATVSGSHTYGSAGSFQPTVVVQDDTGKGSATATDALTVLADVTSHVHPVSSGPIYNPLTQLFNGNVTITNIGATTLTGPFPIVFQGLPAGVTLADATGDTGGGVPYIGDALATLAAGQSGTVAVQFKDPQLVPITYTLQIIDPPPPNPVQLVSAIDPSFISASGANESGNPGPSVSADGRYVAFFSLAENLVPNPQLSTDVNALGSGEVYLRDTQTGITTLISNPAISGYDGRLVISPDGRYVAFDNGTGYTNGSAISNAGSLLLYDRTTGTTTPLLDPSEGPAFFAVVPVFSANSEYLVFDIENNNLVGSTSFGFEQLYERDLQTGTTTLIGVNAAGTAVCNSPTIDASVSADGRYVAFASYATNLVTNDAVGGLQIFVRDLQQDTTTLVSANYAGTDGGSIPASEAYGYSGSANPVISSDGSIVLFDSFATDLLAKATSENSDELFARNLQTATTSAVGLIGGDVVATVAGFFHAAISGDDRYVAFTSLPASGSKAPPGNTSNVYLSDLQTGTTTLVDVNSTGTAAGNGAAAEPLMSADGRFVLFYSTATNLVANPASGTNLYLRDMQLGTTTLVTVNDTGAGDGGTSLISSYSLEVPYALSADDGLVTFASNSGDLVADDNNNTTDVFQRNIASQTTTLLSSADPSLPDLSGTLWQTGGIPQNEGSDLPFVSANGVFVAFDSQNEQLVTGDTTTFQPNGPATVVLGDYVEQVFVRDLKTQTTVLVSANLADTGGGNAASRIVGISADGQMLLFYSEATNLVANDTANTDYQLFVRNLQTDTTSLVTVNEAGTGPGETGDVDEYAQISANDRFVAFASYGTDLVSNDRVGGNQLFVRDLQLGTTSLVSVDAAGTNGGNEGSGSDYYANFGEQISADGRYVVFQSSSDNLVPNDDNGATDVFVRDLQTGTTSLVSVNHSGTESGNGTSVLTNDAHETWQNGIDPFTPDGRYVVFTSDATDLVSNGNITGGQNVNVYVRDLVDGTTTLVSVNADGTVTGGDFEQASISADGRYVSFLSSDELLVSPSVSSQEQLYVRNMQTSVTRLVSDGPTNMNGAAVATGGISANGQYVIFESNVLIGYEAGRYGLFVSDLLTGITRQVDASLDGDDGSDAGIGAAQLSADGSTIVFSGGYDNLVVGAFDEVSNVYAYTIPTPAKLGTLIVSASPIHTVEGTGFTAVLASFSDTDDDPIGNYTATIDWGDGGTSPGTITANADGSFNVTGTHTFAEAGFYPIEITVSDRDGTTASASTTVVETNPSGDITYPIEVDTSALKGTTGSLVLQFNPGATPKAQPATVSVSNFSVMGGSLTSASTSRGGASGSFTGTAQLANSTVLNEIQQGITFGSSVRFEITIAGAAVEQPGNGDFGSTFAVQLLGADGVTPQATIDPSGAVNTVDVNPDGSTRVANFPTSSQGGPPIAGIPNVADALLLASGTTLQATVGTPFTAAIATFTDAKPDAPLSDYLTPTITWGDGQTSTGTITRGSNGTFDVTGTHTYSGRGKFTAGVTVIDTGGSVATITVQIIVNQGTPSVTWRPPAAITFGIALSATQLDATASVAGTWTYTPVAGTVLHAGSHTFSVTFTPSDTTDYTPVTKSVQFTVKQATLTVTANNASKVYGAANPTFRDTITGFVNGQTASVLSRVASVTTTATATSHAGKYAITAGGASDPDYAITYVSGTLTINPARLTIAAVSETMFYGSARPPLTVTYTGLVNGDTAATFATHPNTAPKVSTVPATSALGTYVITVSAAYDPDYIITYVDGTLTILPPRRGRAFG